jgi:hypothetical protein
MKHALGTSHPDPDRKPRVHRKQPILLHPPTAGAMLVGQFEILLIAAARRLASVMIFGCRIAFSSCASVGRFPADLNQSRATFSTSFREIGHSDCFAARWATSRSNTQRPLLHRGSVHRRPVASHSKFRGARISRPAACWRAEPRREGA